MNSLLSQLSTTHLSTVLMLNSISLDVVTKAAQGLQSDMSRMLTEWLNLEERGTVYDSDPDPDDENGWSPEVPVQGVGVAGNVYTVSMQWVLSSKIIWLQAGHKSSAITLSN